MSSPFGGHPTFGQYIAWARQEGCTIQQGVVHNKRGQAHSVTKIVSPDGKRWVIEVGTQHSEYLVPTTISRFDRRLAINSPFFSLPN